MVYGTVCVLHNTDSLSHHNTMIQTLYKVQTACEHSDSDCSAYKTTQILVQMVSMMIKIMTAGYGFKEIHATCTFNRRWQPYLSEILWIPVLQT
jgi:hypothetical protein